MGVQHLTVVICDRCGTTKLSDDIRTELAGWAESWPQTTTSFGSTPYHSRGDGAVVCPACVTEAERRQQLEQERGAEIPF
jgi:hypothetical protein